MSVIHLLMPGLKPTLQVSTATLLPNPMDLAASQAHYHHTYSINDPAQSVVLGTLHNYVHPKQSGGPTRIPLTGAGPVNRVQVLLVRELSPKNVRSPSTQLKGSTKQMATFERLLQESTDLLSMMPFRWMRPSVAETEMRTCMSSGSKPGRALLLGQCAGGAGWCRWSFL